MGQTFSTVYLKPFFQGQKPQFLKSYKAWLKLPREKMLICDRYPIGSAHVQLSTEVRRKRDGSQINYFNHQLWEENVFKRVIDQAKDFFKNKS